MINIVSSNQIPSSAPPAEQSAQTDRITALFCALIEAICLLKLYIDYYLARLETSLASHERGRLFAEEYIAKTGNHGKKEDFGHYLQSTIPDDIRESFEKTAKQFGFTLEASPELSPFGNGNCFGGSMLFCKQWLETGKIAAEEFQGIPYEGVLLQALYIALTKANYSETSTSVGHEIDIKRAIGASIGCEATCIGFNQSPKEILSSFTHLDNGAYLLRVPVYNCIGWEVGAHALTVIKTDLETYFYDTNTAIGKKQDHPEELLARSFEVYCGDIIAERNALMRALHRIKNFFLLQANAPLFSEVSHSFDIYRIDKRSLV